jgi:hypothetical protein
MVDNFSIQEVPKPRPLLRFGLTVCHHPVMTNNSSSSEKKTPRKVCNRRSHPIISYPEPTIVRCTATGQTRRSHCISGSESVGQSRYRVQLPATTEDAGHRDQRSIRSCIRSALNHSKTSAVALLAHRSPFVTSATSPKVMTCFI